MFTNGALLVIIQPPFFRYGRYLRASIGSIEIMISHSPFGIRSLKIGSEESLRLLCTSPPLWLIP